MFGKDMTDVPIHAQEHHDRRSILTIHEERDAFIRGFRLGVQILSEALKEEKNTTIPLKTNPYTLHKPATAV